MRVTVTGATGFIGSHVVRRLVAAGHEAVALVRSRDRLASAIGDEVGGVEVVIGDVTDPVAVARAISGSDAAVHAAGLVSVDAHRSDELQRVNVDGTRLVLGEAVRSGLDPVVHLSSIAALFPPSGPVVRVDDEVHQGRSPYSRSKAGAELVARGLQDTGAPVATVYPGGVWGPDAPTLGEPLAALAAILRLPTLVVLDTPGGMPTIDVRDVERASSPPWSPGSGRAALCSVARFSRLPTWAGCSSGSPADERGSCRCLVAPCAPRGASATWCAGWRRSSSRSPSKRWSSSPGAYPPTTDRRSTRSAWSCARWRRRRPTRSAGWCTPATSTLRPPEG